MADVARHAGVSAQTVSRVSNGVGPVRAHTREAVLQAMHDLGYRPNSAARALKRGSFHNIGVVSETLRTIGDIRTIEAIAQSAAREGYATTLIPIDIGQNAPLPQRPEELAVDAILVLNIGAPTLAAAGIAVPPTVPVVLMGSAVDDVHALVATDQVGGARQATEHLLALGHRTVHHLAGPLSSYPARRREAGWRETLTEHGRAAPEVLHGDWSAGSGYEVGRALAADATCTAVFCANDQMALGLYRALREAGRRVPNDVSVVGFDDTPDSVAFDPPLTSVRQEFADAGRRAVAAAMTALRGGALATLPDVVPTSLIVRSSCAAPRS